MNIDPKEDGVAEPLAAAIVRTDSVDRVCVGAFSDRRIAVVQALRRDRRCAPRWVRVRSPTWWRLLAACRAGRDWSPCAQVPPSQGRAALVTPRFVDTAHRLGVQVHVWTIDDRHEMERLLDLGVDGIMTDRPQILKGLLSERGTWAGR